MTASSLRDQQMQQLGITQYQLRRPAVLQGEVAVLIPAQTRLVIVAEQLPALTEPLLVDIIRAAGLRHDNVYYLTAERAVMLPQETQCALWLLGDVDVNASGEVKLTSQPFNELSNSAAEKRALWQQLYQYEHYFFPAGG